MKFVIPATSACGCRMMKWIRPESAGSGVVGIHSDPLLVGQCGQNNYVGWISQAEDSPIIRLDQILQISLFFWRGDCRIDLMATGKWNINIPSLLLDSSA